MPENVARIFVDARGQIYLNGAATDLPSLQEKFSKLKKSGGSVEYSRAAPAGEPTPEAMEVIKAIADANLPVRLLEPAR